MKQAIFALWVSLSVVSVAGAVEPSGPWNLATDDGLLAFVQRSDTVMSRVLDVCRDVSIVRYRQDGVNAFRLKASCSVKANAEENLDCPEYRIDATGTIDNAIQATLRQLSMSLVCTA